MLALGAILTLAGGVGLVVAFRHGQADRPALERRWFTGAVAAFAVGSMAFVASVLLG